MTRIPHLVDEWFDTFNSEIDLELEVTVQGGEAAPAAKPIGKGLRLTDSNAQKTLIVRSRQTAFTWQAPYPGWDEFGSTAKGVFATLREKLGFRTVSSVGLRYVNRIDVPLNDKPQITVADYLLFGVSAPNAFTHRQLRGYHVVADVSLEEGMWVRVQASTAGAALIQHASLMFDIDVITDQQVPQKESDLWDLVERMRSQKNLVFECGVTDEARRLFGWAP